MVCFRCDGKGKFKNEFGLMEKCESCQGADMTFEKADDQVSNDQWDWEKREINVIFSNFKIIHNWFHNIVNSG